MQKKDEAYMSEITHRFIETNGIRMHLAEAGSGPLVLLIHGFPELWYSWRHQLLALADAGYHAVAPDVRGYGETEAPQEVESYRLLNLATDIVGILDALGEQQAALVGNDWGANIVWWSARLFPERFRAVAILNIPYEVQPPASSQMLKQWSGDAFNFALYFQQVGVAERELEADVRRTLRLFFYALSGDAPADLIPYLFTRKPANAGVLDGMPEPPRLPDWLSEADLDYNTQIFTRTGFRGALSKYRARDLDWEELSRRTDSTVQQPVLFIGGERDSTMRFARLDAMKSLPNLRKIVRLPGCGHWTQQERPAEVNAELLAFLPDLDC
jgi:pimeloyl-ACP methyl ester carboxylesterase